MGRRRAARGLLAVAYAAVAGCGGTSAADACEAWRAAREQFVSAVDQQRYERLADESGRAGNSLASGGGSRADRELGAAIRDYELARARLVPSLGAEKRDEAHRRLSELRRTIEPRCGRDPTI